MLVRLLSKRVLVVPVLLLMIVLGSVSSSTLPLWGQTVYPVIHMQDTTVSFGSFVYAGRQINAEYVTSASQLIGDKIDSITVNLQRVGSPTGTAEVGIFNTNLSVKKLFGTISVSSISTTFSNYEFVLSGSELYTIVSGDRIGIKYNGGTSSAGINVMIDRDEANPFDSTSSHRIRYESAWLYFDTVEDLYMILKQTHADSQGDTTPPTITATPAGGTYPTAQSVALSSNESPTTIYYTRDGSDPRTSGSRTVYSSPIAISTTTILRYYGLDGAGNPSAPQTQNYVISSTPQTVGLTVRTQNGAGAAITGYYITLRQNGDLISTGFSPNTFNIQTGQQYVVGVADYGTMVFHHWLDTGSTERYRTISVASATTITSIMCSSGSSCPPAVPPSTASIGLSPASGLPGVLVTVTGSAFSPNSIVTITYDGATRSTTPSTVTTSSGGTFSASFTVPTTSAGSHTVRATDATSKSATATFTDNTSGSSAPTANSQSVTTNENSPRTITLSGSDPNGDPLEFYIISEPAHGALTLIDQTTRQIRYTPWSYYNGPDSFTFAAHDGILDSAPATVSITVSNTAQKSTSRLVIESILTNELTVSGLQVTLSQNSAVIQTAPTPYQFSLNSGQQYSISASNGSNLVFDHWLDTGSTNRARTVSIADDTLLVAVYRTS
jgi:chitobiase/beta-hexosaminidase-like protein/Big-like domain-containing protein